MTANTCSPWQAVAYRALQPKLYTTRNLWIYTFLKSHHNCDAYTHVQKKWSTFFTAFKHQQKKLTAHLLCNISQLSLMSLSFESSLLSPSPCPYAWGTTLRWWYWRRWPLLSFNTTVCETNDQNVCHQNVSAKNRDQYTPLSNAISNMKRFRQMLVPLYWHHLFVVSMFP